ncbi:MAG TPA: bifunctional pyr operon transcriptional regulator/uracil phosphoribosyltransferase PyrR [Thiotrichaceae bacterium]|jgi:pyrimidine operon attenuation protein/uracil phosphoribosyltransferase|nr:bifunctional pyr operon transcriptional regulator/uracil phosphoribosyltransferase PyrR [Thiotrichaceae bacterium]HIM07133.1 bifunctional pyr operon transcriptional regulator/uracil phosphoribosyltransferase PyrR [Gammaproteobacteria bacterium]
MSDAIDIDQLLSEMTEATQTHCNANGYDNPLMIGIQRGGAWVANRLHQSLKLAEPLGELNIAFYRDDFSTLGLHPEVSPSKLPAELNNRHIILVDDVLYTGRTIRAAMNEIFDYGRPASITLVVMIDRCGRQLPIQADVVGKTMTLNTGEHVKLSGPEPLTLSFDNVEGTET